MIVLFTQNLFWILDPLVKKAPDPRSATLLCIIVGTDRLTNQLTLLSLFKVNYTQDCPTTRVIDLFIFQRPMQAVREPPAQPPAAHVAGVPNPGTLPRGLSPVSRCCCRVHTTLHAVNQLLGIRVFERFGSISQRQGGLQEDVVYLADQ